MKGSRKTVKRFLNDENIADVTELTILPETIDVETGLSPSISFNCSTNSADSFVINIDLIKLSGGKYDVFSIDDVSSDYAVDTTQDASSPETYGSDTVVYYSNTDKIYATDFLPIQVTPSLLEETQSYVYQLGFPNVTELVVDDTTVKSDDAQCYWECTSPLYPDIRFICTLDKITGIFNVAEQY